MRNQFQPETLPEQAYTPPIAPPVEHTAPLGEQTTAQAELTPSHKGEVQNTQAVHEWLTTLQRQTRRAKARYWSLFIFFQAFLFVPIFLSNTFPLFSNNHFNFTMLALMFAPSIGMTLLALWAFLRKPIWNADELRRVGGVEAVGILLELLSAPKSLKQLTPLYTALTQLLPQMKASDAIALTRGQRRLLYGSLKNGFGNTISPGVYQNYRLAILKALEQIGDADAIPLVASLAKGRWRTASQKALKAAALECLPLLRVSFGGMEATKTLLRASSPQPSAPAMLLRPTEFRTEANPNQLLHAVETLPSPSPGE